MTPTTLNWYQPGMGHMTSATVYNLSTHLHLDGNYSDFEYDGLFDASLSHMTASRLLALIIAAIGLTANVITMLAILHIRGPMTVNRRMITSLVTGDIFVCISVIIYASSDGNSGPNYSIENYASICLFIVAEALLMASHVISLFNLLCLAFDHYMAINNAMIYPQFVTRRRATVVIVTVWIVSYLCGFSRFLVPTATYKFCLITAAYCNSVSCSTYETKYLLYPLVLICFVTMFVLYIKIFATIYWHQQKSGRHKRYMKKNIKGVVTTMVILGSFLVCWLPYCLLEVWATLQIVVDHDAIMTKFITIMNIDYYLYVLLLFHCLCDPIIYAVRMPDVQRGYRRLFHRKVLTRKQSEQSMIGRSSTVRVDV